MEIINIDLNYIAKEESVIALGNFDGVHKGHVELINRAINNAKKLNIKSSILIFKEHTDNIINPKKKNLITTNETKFEIFRKLGVDIVYIINFTRKFMNYSPDRFIKEFLIDSLKIKAVVVGYDYTYGYMKKGDIKHLLKYKDKFQIIDIVDEIKEGGHKISSTWIRKLILSGQIKEANILLTRPYKLIGKVIHAKGLGQKMGYPTANLDLIDNFVIPKFGVYDSNIIIGEKSYKAATNIGTNPTVENDGIKVESHILNFNEDIYDKVVELELIDFIRPELTFETINELFEQIKKDTNIILKR